jgi:twitching motility protein PilT
MSEPDVDRLVDELNALTTPRSEPGDSRQLDSWLRALVERAGSDLLLVAGAPATIRLNGEVVALGGPLLTGEEIEDAITPALSARQLAAYRETQTVDASIRSANRVRFRLNLHRERGRAAAAIRVLPRDVPNLASLGFPHPIDLLGRLARGLVLVCGPTGSGKTTTLAALVGEMNRRDRRHIITIEDPIEFEHVHGTCLVEQQELGVDVIDFPSALRASVRQSPDVIVVGEMRDPETMRLALSAAETGHLVLTTLHATDVAAAVSRIVDSFPPEGQHAVRQELAMALAAVLVQGLVVRADGRGRVPFGELLVATYGARQHIRKNAPQHLNQEVTISRKLGSFSVEESLARLVQAGTVDRQPAMVRAAHPEELEKLLT